jgi:hypothetical protein
MSNNCVRVFNQYFNLDKNSEKYSNEYISMDIIKDLEANELIITIYSRWNSSNNKVIKVQM